MKKYSFLSLLLLTNFFTLDLLSMDQRHIPRKKTLKNNFRNSKEEEMARLINEDDSEYSGLIKHSKPISIAKAERRSSTGQINLVQRTSEKEISFSPRLLKRENSQGSICVTPEKKEILDNYFYMKDVSRRKSQEKLEKLNQLKITHESSDLKNQELKKSKEKFSSTNSLRNSAKWFVLRSSLEKCEEKE